MVSRVSYKHGNAKRPEKYWNAEKNIFFKYIYLRIWNKYHSNKYSSISVDKSNFVAKTKCRRNWQPLLINVSAPAGQRDDF